MNDLVRIAASALTVAALTLVCPFESAFAKKWTVTERIEKLTAEIDEGQQAKELTVEQVDSLKDRLRDIKERIDRSQRDNDGHISLPDQRRIHQQLNDLSVKILELRLKSVYFD